MSFNSVTNPPATKFDNVSGQIRVNRAGYRSARDQINSMLMAGQNLVKLREEAYNTVKELNDENFSNYIDLPESELLAINPLLATTVKRRKEALAESVAAEKAKAAQNATSGVIKQVATPPVEPTT